MEILDIFFNRVEITIVNCPPSLNGAEVEYEDGNVSLMGVVEDGKLVIEVADAPEIEAITWGSGTWKIRW